MPKLRFERPTTAPIDVLWGVLTDHRGYTRWGAAERVTLEVEGSPDVNGTGAVRRIEQGPVRVREQILEFEPPRRFRYTVLSGPPVKDYFAEVRLTESAGGTALQWRVDFEPRLRGTGHVVAWVVGAVIQRLMKKAIREAERRTREAR